MNDWVMQQVVFLRALTRCEVLGWQGIEMALRGAGPNDLPDWRDSSAPFLQLARLDAHLADGRLASIVTYQNDDQWGLYRTDSLPPLELQTNVPASIFRSRVLNELPKGIIDDVSVSLLAGDIAEVRLEVAGREMRLRAGEVYEQNDGSLRVVPLDESVLVQVDGWHPEMTGHAEPFSDGSADERRE